jgi:hypothetical protein
MGRAEKGGGGDIVSAVRQVVKFFLINGFAYYGGVKIVAGPTSGIAAAGATLEVKFVGPATLWSGRALRVRQSVVVNDFM